MDKHSVPKTKTSEHFGEPPNTPPVATALSDDNPIQNLGDKIAAMRPHEAGMLEKYLGQKGVEIL